MALFRNQTFRQGLEHELKALVIRDLSLRTNLRVADPGNAESVLQGRISRYDKKVLQENQRNEALAFELAITVEASFMDVRIGYNHSRKQTFRGVEKFVLSRGESEVDAQQEVLRDIADDMLDAFLAYW